MSAWLAFFRKRWAEPPPSVETGRHRFYVAATYGYPCGFVWHFVFIGLFWWAGARPLALLNVGATVIWALALLLHLSGKLRSAVVLAALDEIGGIGGRFNLALEESPPVFARLARPVPVRYARLEGKAAGRVDGEGLVFRLARHCVELAVDGRLEAMADLKMNLASVGEVLAARDFYGKVIRDGDGREAPAVVRLTSVPPEVDAFLEALRRYAAGPG